jgi:hypothetical protein
MLFPNNLMLHEPMNNVKRHEAKQWPWKEELGGALVSYDCKGTKQALNCPIWDFLTCKKIHFDFIWAIFIFIFY